MPMNRRSFIANFSLASGGLALACGALGRRAQVLAQTGDISALRAAGYGPIAPMAAKNTGEVLLALPKGFEYTIFGKIGSEMADGRKVPPRHDGMWAFKVGKETRLIRNHEVVNGNVPREGSAIGTSNHYDPAAGGGTTTVVLDNKTRTAEREFVSLSGTLVNCAGGPTPWGSWISCEETTIGKEIRTTAAGAKIGGFEKPHGYCFEVPASANGPVPAVPLTAMGRFVHEAVAVDEKTGVVYLTEDAGTSGFYRFLPAREKQLAQGGKLQMLAVKGWEGYDTRTNQAQGDSVLATWVDIDDPDPASAGVDPLAVYKQGAKKGGAIFNRLEGCCIDEEGRVYFVSTAGGNAKSGQIWAYIPTSEDEGELKLLFESPSKELMYMPDNICHLPKSEMLLICEDGDYPGTDAKNHLRILTPEGLVSDLAQNVSKDAPRSEFAGACFAPDGKTLFVNLQTAGVTLAIWGPFNKFKS